MKCCSYVIETCVLFIFICFMYHNRMSYPEIIQTKFAVVHRVTTVNLYCIECMFSVIQLERFNNTMKRSLLKLTKYPVHSLSWLAKAGKDWWRLITVLAKPDKTCVWLWLTVWLLTFKFVIRALNSWADLVSVLVCPVTPPSYYCTYAIFSKGLYIFIRNDIN